MRKKLVSVLGGLAVLVIASAAVLASQDLAKSFSISAEHLTSITTPGGHEVDYVLFVKSQGYAGKVTLSCQPTPPSLSCSVSPAVVDLNSNMAAAATVNVQAAGSATPGMYPLIIVAGPASGAGGQHSVTLLLRVIPKV